MAQQLFLVHLGATLLLTGLVWFVQVVHYPLFAAVGRVGFAAYEAAHTRLTSYVVAPLMLAEASTAVALVWYRPANLESPELWFAGGLLLVIWLSTIAWQVPQHQRLAAGFDARAHRTLVRGNWLRTIAWSLRSVTLLGALGKGA
jgi:hypothetical protein